MSVYRYQGFGLTNPNQKLLAMPLKIRYQHNMPMCRLSYKISASAEKNLACKA